MFSCHSNTRGHRKLISNAVFVSIHLNLTNAGSRRQSNIFLQSRKPSAVFGDPLLCSRGVHPRPQPRRPTPRLFVLRRTTVSRQYRECGFLTNPTEAPTRKPFPTGRSSRRKLQPVSAAATPSQALFRRREWQRAKAFRCNRTSIKPRCRNLNAANPSVRTKKARAERKAHRNQVAQRQKRRQKIRRDN